jgi:hypothetical protein
MHTKCVRACVQASIRLYIHAYTHRYAYIPTCMHISELYIYSHAPIVYLTSITGLRHPLSLLNVACDYTVVPKYHASSIIRALIVVFNRWLFSVSDENIRLLQQYESDAISSGSYAFNRHYPER